MWWGGYKDKGCCLQYGVIVGRVPGGSRRFRSEFFDGARSAVGKVRGGGANTGVVSRAHVIANIVIVVIVIIIITIIMLLRVKVGPSRPAEPHEFHYTNRLFTRARTERERERVRETERERDSAGDNSDAYNISQPDRRIRRNAITASDGVRGEGNAGRATRTVECLRKDSSDSVVGERYRHTIPPGATRIFRLFRSHSPCPSYPLRTPS